MTNIVFFGTHDFAATVLRGLLTSPFIKVAAVVTQPDKPVGRHQEVIQSPVKILAENKRLPIFQPTSLENFNIKYSIFNIDLFIVAQYGLIIPKVVLDTPCKGCVNVHASLLPNHRGASPIQTALMNGDKETGVTIMLMDDKMDHGPILTQQKIAINPDDNFETLSSKLASAGSELLLQTIPLWAKGKIKPIPQDHAQATFTKILSRDDGKIDWQKSAEEIYNLWRGLTPWPGVWTTWKGKRLKLLRLHPARETIGPGVVQVANNEIIVGCGKGSVKIEQLQLEGKKAMDSRTFLAGYRNIESSVLGVNTK